MSSSATTVAPDEAETNSHSNKRRRPVMTETEQDVPKSKRIACIICRRRKLKCDGNKPSCATCTRLNHSCAYDEIRKKSGPKRGYVKALEERLKQVETMLKHNDPIIEKTPEVSSTSFVITGNNDTGLVPIISSLDMNVTNPSITYDTSRDQEQWQMPREMPMQQPLDDLAFSASLDMELCMEESNFAWEMIGLGLDEPMPPQETIDDLHQIYFDKVHPSLPMIHKYRYLAAMNLAPGQRPPVALRYAMWTMACSVTDKYNTLKEHFYQRARKYMEQDYMKGHGENIISVAHCQTHILLAAYEFKMMFFPRAWMSTGAASRLAQMMSLHRLDGVGLDIKQCLPGPRDWTEREERRRTFWMAFCEDRYASIGTGWPMTFNEQDILTDLPASDEAYEKSKQERTQTLEQSLMGSGAASLSPFAGVVLMACLFGRNLLHLHRPDSDVGGDHDLHGEFWKRHRHIDSILLSTSLHLPNHLKLPAGLSNPNIVFTNMNLHTSTICLHQAAIYKADKNRLPASVSKESKLRCITAANEIARIMRMISHLDLERFNPFMCFCLYVAARVFVQYLKSRPDDSPTSDGLRFLLSAMNAMKSKNPLTESFLVQLDVDLETLGARNVKFKHFTQFARNLANTNTPPPFGTKLQSGPNGSHAQCNFMKIVEDVDPDATAKSGSYTTSTAPGPRGENVAEKDAMDPVLDNMPTFQDQNMASSGNNQSIDSFGQTVDSGFISDGLSWMQQTSPPSRSQSDASISQMQRLFPEVSHSEVFNHGSGSQQRSIDYELNRANGGKVLSHMGEMDFSESQTPDRPTPSSSSPSTINSVHHSHQQSHPTQTSYPTLKTNMNNHKGVGIFANENVNYEMNNASASNSTGLTPGDSGTMPGRDNFGLLNGWEVDAQQGLTPVGQGMMMMMMDMEPMWDGRGTR